MAGLLRAACANLDVTLVQTRARAAVRGRVMSLLMLGVLGLLPLSTALSGLLGSVLGPRAVFVGGGLIVTVAGGYALSRRPFRQAS